MFPPALLKVLLSICLISGPTSAVSHSFIHLLLPPTPIFSFLLSLLFDLLKPLSFSYSAANVLPHTLRLQGLCQCACVVCKSCNWANLTPTPSCIFPPVPCLCSLAWRCTHSCVCVIARRRHGRGWCSHRQGLGRGPTRVRVGVGVGMGVGVGLRMGVGVGGPG